MARKRARAINRKRSNARYTESEKRAYVRRVFAELERRPSVAALTILREMGLSSYAYTWMRDPQLGGRREWSGYPDRPASNYMHCPRCRCRLRLEESR